MALPIRGAVGFIIVLEVLKLTHTYGNQTALEDVSFEVGGNELVSIVGKSGCGKQLITGIANALGRYPINPIFPDI